MKEKVTPFLKKLLDKPSIFKQYIINTQAVIDTSLAVYNDPLLEDSHEPIKGLIHKYKNRALIKVSYQCAAHCRFCTRIRQIGNPEGTLSESDIDHIITYLHHHPEIEDVILSGGDPFYTPKLTSYLLDQLKDIDSVKVIRIGTRLPFHNPKSFQTPLLKKLLTEIDQIGKTKPFYILIHVEHPDELTDESRACVQQLRNIKVTLLSQTVFLKDINDEVEILYTLFKNLYYMGVQPYYLYHCDQVKGLESFMGDIEKEKKIATQLRARLSGIATPLFVEDIENGYGKIPI